MLPEIALNATQTGLRPTLPACNSLRKSLTHHRWRARTAATRITDLEQQLERARASLARHQAAASAAEAELLERDPTALDGLHDVSRGAR